MAIELKVNRQKLMKIVEDIEGREYTMYMLDDKIPHIGIGHNIISRPLADETLEFLGIEDESDLMTATLNDDQVEYLFNKDLDIAISDAILVIGEDVFDALDATRQTVLVDMSFNLGRPRFKLFKKMIEGVQEGDFNKAAAEILDSEAARDPKTKKRYERLSKEMKHGDTEVAKIASPEPTTFEHERNPKLATFTDHELVKELYVRQVIGL